MYKVITDPEERKLLINKALWLTNKRSLKEFAQKSGYGDGFMTILFKEDLEDDLYSFSKEAEEIKDNQVVLMVDYPATISDDKEVHEDVYLDFDEFYDYLVDEVNRKIKESPNEKIEYEELLANVKAALGV